MIVPTAFMMMMMSMIMPTSLSVYMMMVMMMIMSAPFTMNMMMIMATAGTVSVIIALISMLTVLFHITVSRSSAMRTPSSLLLLLLLSDHLINYGLLCFLFRHLIPSNKLHCLFCHKPVNFLAFLFHKLLNVDALITEPSEIVSY